MINIGDLVRLKNSAIRSTTLIEPAQVHLPGRMTRLGSGRRFRGKQRIYRVIRIVWSGRDHYTGDFHQVIEVADGFGELSHLDTRNLVLHRKDPKWVSGGVVFHANPDFIFNNVLPVIETMTAPRQPNTTNVWEIPVIETMTAPRQPNTTNV